MAVNNYTIMGKFLQSGSNDAQRRIPAPSQSSMRQTVDALFAPQNNKVYNEFVDALVNRIGDTIVHNKAWENPLQVFKGSKLNYGSSVQEIATKWIKAHSYTDEDDLGAALLKMNRPGAVSVFHSMNRQDRYDITVNRDELRQAFVTEYGLNAFVDSIMTVPRNSDFYDEYRAMLQLIAFYEDSWGFYKHHVDAVPTDEASAKEVLKAMRTYAGLLKFPSTLYNAGVIEEIPVFEKDASRLVLLTTPNVVASLDVDALAQLFHIERADVPFRIVEIDEMPIPDAFALLTTEDFFVAKDVEYTTASFFSPATLSTNYFLHHWEILSVSPFVPAILFTTGTGSETDVITYAPATLTAGFVSTADEPELAATRKIKLTASLTGTITGITGNTEVPPASSTTWEVVSLYIPGDTVTQIPINSRTYVDRNNILHLQKKGLVTDANMKVDLKATSTYVNPSGATEPIEDELSITFTMDEFGAVTATV